MPIFTGTYSLVKISNKQVIMEGDLQSCQMEMVSLQKKSQGENQADVYLRKNKKKSGRRKENTWWWRHKMESKIPPSLVKTLRNG